MKRLMKLDSSYWTQVFGLMRGRGFPNVPERFEDACMRFGMCRMFGVEREGRLEVVFVFGPAEDGIAFLDVVCAEEARGVWASRALMGELARMAFTDMGLRCVWVQVHSRAALKAALQAGFVAVTGLDVREPVLAMTPLSSSLPAYALRAAAR